MTVSEFDSYLQKGLGRAILLLRKEPDKEPFREAVWNHAIHDPRYDRQCNASRGHYIKALFDCFTDGDAMLSELFRVYGEEKVHPEDTRYYINNLEEMMKDGVDGASAALDALYRVLLKELLTLPNPLTNGCDHERDNYHFAASTRYRFHHDVLDELVRDGITLLQKSERYDITDFTDFFDNEIRVSKTEEFNAILAAIEKEDPAYKVISEDYRRESEELPKRWVPKKEDTLIKPTNWREAIDYAIQKGEPRIPVNKSLWQNLSAEDGAEIARLVEEESDPERRFVLLWQLCHYGEELLRQYPRDPLPLIAELERGSHITFPYTSENKLLWALSRVVAKICHPAVRKFALRLLPYYAEKHDSISYSCIIKAWMTNYRPKDADTLEAFVTSLTDTDILHEIGMDMIEAEKVIPESVLLYLYENNPCSSCRSRVFLSLMARYGDMTNLPEPLASIRKEAQLDCDYGTRMQAKAQTITREAQPSPTKNNIELFAVDLHFLGNTEKERAQDCCLHGKATLRINGQSFADGIECCLTASALRFLRTLHRDHKTGEEEFLFPCCGNMLIPAEDGRTVTVIGCPNGTEFPIYHVGNHVVLGLGKDEQRVVAYEEYREAVKSYAEAILTFIKNSPPRHFANEYNRKGFEAFLTEYQDLLSR